MEVTIKIESEEFAKTITQDLNDLPKETIREITLKAAEQFLTKEDTLKKLFISEGGGYYNSKQEPSQLFWEIAKTIDWSPLFSDIAIKAKRYMSEKYPELMAQALASILERSMFGGKAFQDAIMFGISSNREALKELLST